MSTVNPPRQLNLDELRRLKWLLGGALALVSLWTIFFLDIEAVGLVAVAGAAILAALAWPQLPGRVPAIAWKLAVPAIILAVAADFYFSGETLPVLIRLASLLVLFRAVSYRRKREDLQLIVLGLFLVVVAGVLTVSLGFVFLLLLFTATALAYLFVINLLDAAESGVVRTPAAESAWTRLGWRAFLGRLWAVADWRLLAFAGALFVVVVGMSALLFLVIPRFELASGFFLDKYITRKSRTGFSETVKFGDVAELVRDDSIAMRADVTDLRSIRDGPYWRLAVLDEYTPQGFRISARLKRELLGSQRETQALRGRHGTAGPVAAVGGQWTLYVEPGISRFLPLPGSFGALRLREPAQVQTTIIQHRADPATLVRLEGMRLVALRTEPMAMTAFLLDGVETSGAIPDAAFGRYLGAGPAGRAASGYDGRIMLEGPQGPANEAVLRDTLAAIPGGREQPAMQFVTQATGWLRSRHAYTLSARIPAGPADDIVKWIASTEPGFCEHFAAGLVVLCRAAGYPARVVVGFHGGTLNAYENYFMVRNSDAHAWAEVFDGAGAWIRVDPTPGAALPGAESAAQAARQVQDGSWNARFDSLRVLWYRRIVNFDSRQQVRMLENVKSFTTDAGVALRARLAGFSAHVKAWLGRAWDPARVGWLTGELAAAAAAGWSLWWLGRRIGRRWLTWRRPETFDPVRREAGRWLARRRSGAPDPTAGGAVIADLRRLRYGRRETWPEPRGVFRRARRAGKARRG
jgi:hypothetical protein